MPMAKSVTVIPATKNIFTALHVAEKMIRRVAAYARVSTDSEEQLSSYEAQIIIIQSISNREMTGNS